MPGPSVETHRTPEQPSASFSGARPGAAANGGVGQGHVNCAGKCCSADVPPGKKSPFSRAQPSESKPKAERVEPENWGKSSPGHGDSTGASAQGAATSAGTKFESPPSNAGGKGTSTNTNTSEHRSTEQASTANNQAGSERSSASRNQSTFSNTAGPEMPKSDTSRNQGAERTTSANHSVGGSKSQETNTNASKIDSPKAPTGQSFSRDPSVGATDPAGTQKQQPNRGGERNFTASSSDRFDSSSRTTATSSAAAGANQRAPGSYEWSGEKIAKSPHTPTGPAFSSGSSTGATPSSGALREQPSRVGVNNFTASSGDRVSSSSRTTVRNDLVAASIDRRASDSSELRAEKAVSNSYNSGALEVRKTGNNQSSSRENALQQKDGFMQREAKTHVPGEISTLIRKDTAETRRSDPQSNTAPKGVIEHGQTRVVSVPLMGVHQKSASIVSNLGSAQATTTLPSTNAQTSLLGRTSQTSATSTTSGISNSTREAGTSLLATKTSPQVLPSKANSSAHDTSTSAVGRSPVAPAHVETTSRTILQSTVRDSGLLRTREITKSSLATATDPKTTEKVGVRQEVRSNSESLGRTSSTSRDNSASQVRNRERVMATDTTSITDRSERVTTSKVGNVERVSHRTGNSNEVASERTLRGQEVRGTRRISNMEVLKSGPPRTNSRIRPVENKTRVEQGLMELQPLEDLRRKLEELEEQFLEHAVRTSRPGRATTRELLSRAKKLRIAKAAKTLEELNRKNKGNQSETSAEPSETAAKATKGSGGKIAVQPKVKAASQTPTKSLNTVLVKADDGGEEDDPQ